MKFKNILTLSLCFGISCNALVEGIVRAAKGYSSSLEQLCSVISMVIFFPCAFVGGLFLYWSIRELIGHEWHYPVLGLRIKFPKDIVEVDKEVE